MRPLLAFPLALAMVLCPVSFGQSSSPAQSSSAREKAAAVTYLFPEQVTIDAGKPAAVDLHFKVADGLHINSHEPHAEELIPTTISLPDSTGVHLANATFPPGKDFTFAINPNEKLNVYTGEFIVHTTIVSTKGEHLVQGTLHYQACNNAACMPPHTIPVVLDVIAK